MSYDADKVRVALVFLNPKMIEGFLGRSQAARKARALVLHDQWLTGFPRKERKPC